MLVGNVCYVTTSYNEDKFQMLIEKHFKEQRKGTKMSDELIEQCCAAYLECKEHSNTPILQKMTNMLNQLDITISDCRDYSSEKSIGDINDAIKAFNKLSTDFLLYNAESN